MMKRIKKDLQAVSKALHKLVQKVAKMQKEVDRLVLPIKKQKAEPIKKIPAKKPAVSKAAPPTATDRVYSIIKRSKKGVSTEALMKKTGYERRTISNVIYRLTKQGKIKTVAKGTYVKA